MTQIMGDPVNFRIFVKVLIRVLEVVIMFLKTVDGEINGKDEQPDPIE
jgi:hypothetical protein